MFKNDEELKEAFIILSRAYSGSWTVEKEFKIENQEITYSGDGYFDPCLILRAMRRYNILELTVDLSFSDIDRIHITGCNIDLLRKLAPHLPRCTTDNLPTILDEIGCVSTPVASTEMTEGVFLGHHHIDGPTWKRYWELKGQPMGPKSGWEIPTSDEVYELVALHAPVSQKPKYGSFFAEENVNPNKKLCTEEIKHATLPG